MTDFEPEMTISSSKEESILKAIECMNADLDNIKEEIKRPQINVWKILFTKLARITVFATILLLFLFFYDNDYSFLCWSLFIGGELFFILIFAKKIIMEWILIYQRFAPEKLRASCRFTPSCSEYMLLAIGKYGTAKGIIKGIKRVLRCRYPNGGIDYP